ncbi:hypothetical protein [Pseudomonas zhanjiangensis]|uniref:Uncharacterized protein n=1 Tax=Pseudomonas zhanjiangensis TaxID=3239015 RepID=A0ABV3YWA5_9PSED
MSNVYNFPSKSIRTEIREGHISEAARNLIREVLVDLKEHNPNSWDKNFCEDMLVHRRQISKKQSEHLERVLDDALLKIEYPNGLPQDFLGF